MGSSRPIRPWVFRPERLRVTEQITTSSLIRLRLTPLAFLALVAACLILARRFATEGHRSAAIVTVVVAVVSFLLPLPFGPLHSVRLFVAVVLGFAWVTAFAVRSLARLT